MSPPALDMEDHPPKPSIPTADASLSNHGRGGPSLDARFAYFCKTGLSLNENTYTEAMKLFSESKHLLSTTISAIGTGTPEEAERYWFAFVLYSVKRLSETNADDSSQGTGGDGFTLCQILRVAKLNIVDFFKELPQFIVKAGPILSNQYGTDWEKRLEIDTHFYKNLLQELAQKEGFTLPEFQTVKCGLPHKPTFFSNVEVEGEIFHGKGAKSKKLAELSAAKVACTVFTERKSTRGGDLSSSGSSAGEMLKCSPSSLDLLTNANPQQSLKPLCSMGSSPAKENEVEEIVLTRDFPVSTKVSLQDTIIASPALLNSEEAQSSSATPPPLRLSALSITASNKQKKTEETKSYLLSNKVRVYTCIPNIAFPEGTVLEL